MWAIFNADDEEKLVNIDGNNKGGDSNFLRLPSKGIPGNPINQNVQPMGNEQKNEFHYSASGGIFDA